MKHFITAAKLGYDEALGTVKKDAHDIVSKEDYEAALRGHQAAIDAEKSQQREMKHTNFTTYHLKSKKDVGCNL